MIKAFRTKTKTIYAEDFCEIVYPRVETTHLIFKDKIVTVNGHYEYDDDLNEYLDNDDSSIFDMPGVEIAEIFNRDNIIYNIHRVMDEYGIRDCDMVVSFGAALVLNDIDKVWITCNDIDIFITQECSYRLEDEYGIKRTIAPSGNTSKQTVQNIDMFAMDGTDIHVYSKHYKFSDHPISVEILDSLIKTYEKRAAQGNSEKYLVKIEEIKANIH